VSYKDKIIVNLDSFGNGTMRKINIDWLNGVLVCTPKDQGGLGIHEVKNTALLSKWL
jgi:hypothetical protein